MNQKYKLSISFIEYCLILLYIISITVLAQKGVLDMGFLDIFKIKEFKTKISSLENKVKELELLLSPEQKSILKRREELKFLNERTNHLSQEINDKHSELKNAENKLKDIEKSISEKNDKLVEIDEEILLQDFALYNPKYDFKKVEEYKARLQKIRQAQKDMIKSDSAVHASTTWRLNNSLSKGRKMIKDMKKLLLRAFNSECDEIIRKVKYNSFDASAKRISHSYEAVSKLGSMMELYIQKPYYDSKIDELTLALEYQLKKQEEKEQKRELREQMREEAKLQKEIEFERQKIAKEERHYKNFLKQLRERIVEATTEEERKALFEKHKETEQKLSDIEKAYEEIDYREANQKAGYVYVISNIGSFGENVYKIGMTRRLDPTERVDELGDSSVPFDFDIHAMIFSDDAPKLENALHKAFEDRKVNMVNKRREFFNVTLDEIKSVVRDNFDKMAEFTDLAEAEAYRISQKIKQQISDSKK